MKVCQLFVMLFLSVHAWEQHLISRALFKNATLPEQVVYSTPILARFEIISKMQCLRYGRGTFTTFLVVYR